MRESREAEEHLRVIRSLMERGTIYRAISAPTALVGAMCAGVGYLGGEKFGVSGFLGIWGGALLLTLVANFYFLWSGAKKRGDSFISAGMKMAFQALLPAGVCALVVTGIFMGYPGALFSLAELTAFWAVFYGLALLATAHFAPGSIRLLGWAFLASGLGFFGCIASRAPVDAMHESNVFMLATFGVLHLVYAACTWPRGKRLSGEHS